MGQDWPTDFPIPGSRLISAFRTDFNEITDSLVTLHVGASDPSPTYPCMMWADTNAGKLKQRNIADTAWIVRGDLETDYGGMLPKSGGTMTGAIDMDSNAITNLPSGSGTAPARYTDLSAYVKADGSIPFTAFPTFPGGSPTVSTQGASKGYVDSKVLLGGTYTGQIVMTVAPTQDNHVMRRIDVDNDIDAHTHSGAAGMGANVPGANISSPSGSDKKLLQADASQGAAFAAVNYLELGGLCGFNMTEIGDLSDSTSWQIVDISSYCPANTRAAFVIPKPTGGGSNWQVAFRIPNGLTGDGIDHNGCRGSENDKVPYPVLAPVYDQDIEVLANRTDGTGTLKLYGIGYIATPFTL